MQLREQSHPALSPSLLGFFNDQALTFSLSPVLGTKIWGVFFEVEIPDRSMASAKYYSKPPVRGSRRRKGGGEGEEGEGRKNLGESLRARGVCKPNAKILVVCMNVGLMAVSFGSDTRICVLCI